jgi:protein disulfide-isomerase A1
LEPEFKKAATELKDEGVVLAACDATVNGGLAAQFDVKGYPTLKFFKNGVAREYNGGRTSDTIVSWIRKRVGPPAKQISGSEVADFSKSAQVAVIAFLDSASSPVLKDFESVASTLEDVVFAYTTDDAAGKAQGIDGEGVVLFKQFDEGKNVLTGDLSEKSIDTFINANRNPLVIPFSMDVVPKIFQSPIGVSAFLFTDNAPAYLGEIAKHYKGKFVFSTSDATQSRLNDYVGVKAADFPKFYIIKNEQFVKFPLEKEVTKENIEAHLDSYLSGSLKPSFKSEPIPESNDEAVKVVVGKNFNSIVLDESKNVFLEVYAPWCGHCKQLAPIWDQLGEHFASNNNVVIAKMDGTGNEADGINVRGFPTLLWFPAGAKTGASGQPYSGERNFEGLSKFISDNIGGSEDDGHDQNDEL